MAKVELMSLLKRHSVKGSGQNWPHPKHDMNIILPARYP